MSGSPASRHLAATLPLLHAELRDAIAAVPRERFLAPADVDRAHEDRAFDFAFGETTPEPGFVALLADHAFPLAGQRLLEIGTGSGYAAAVFAAAGAEVVSLERHEALADTAAERLRPWGVQVHPADGLEGWPASAPFDRIVAAGAVRHVPTAWLRQLADGGCLLVPIGPDEGRQELTRFTREAGQLVRRCVAHVRCTGLRPGRPPGHSVSAR